MSVRPSVRSSVTSFSRNWLIRIFWFFAQWCKMVMPKMWRSPIFEKNFFPGENAGNMPEITVFWTFLKILSLVFCDFLLKDAYQLYIGCNGICFLWKNFFFVLFGPTRRSCKLTYVRPSVTSFSRDWLIGIFWFLVQRCKMVLPKMWRSPIFEKTQKCPK